MNPGGGRAANLMKRRLSVLALFLGNAGEMREMRGQTGRSPNFAAGRIGASPVCPRPVPPACPSGSSLSYCTVLGSQFEFPNTPQSPGCTDTDGTVLTYINEYTSFTNDDFSYYNASTGKTTTKSWSWSPGPNNLKTAYGRCDPFVDCDGDHDVFIKVGGAEGYGAAALLATNTAYQGQSAVSFYWEYDNYPYPAFSDCDECDTDPDGVYNPTLTNAPQTGTVFYFGYDCTVTP